MEFLEKIKQKIFSIGITDNELRLIFFLILILFIGLALKVFKNTYSQHEKFNYTYVDSLFIEYEGRINVTDDVFAMARDTTIINELIRRHDLSKKNTLPPDKKININEASENELALLPNVGTKTAEKIIKYREKTIKFKSIEDVMKIKGIGKKKFEKMKNNITVTNG